MSYLLYLWVIVGYSYQAHDIYDWQYAGEYRGEHACTEAARLLNKPNFRCIPKETTK